MFPCSLRFTVMLLVSPVPPIPQSAPPACLLLHCSVRYSTFCVRWQNIHSVTGLLFTINRNASEWIHICDKLLFANINVPLQHAAPRKIFRKHPANLKQFPNRLQIPLYYVNRPMHCVICIITNRIWWERSRHRAHHYLGISLAFAKWCEKNADQLLLDLKVHWLLPKCFCLDKPTLSATPQ